MAKLLEKQISLPADAFGTGAKFFQSAVLDLSHALFADAKQMTDLPQTVRAVPGQSEPQIQDFSFAGPKVFHEETQSFLPLGALLLRGALGVGHRLGQLEVAVIIKDCIQTDGRPRRRLKVRQMFEAAPRAACEFLRAGEVLAAVRQSFRLLLQ